MAKFGSAYVYFSKLKLQNVRSFAEEQILDLTDAKGRPARWTLILGENGVGKTTLLQCLALMRPIPSVPRSAKTNAPKPDWIEPSALFARENEEIVALVRAGETHAFLAAELSTGKRLAVTNGRGGKIRTQVSISLEKNRELEKADPMPLRRPNFTEPLVVGYSAARHVPSGAAERVDAALDPTASLFDPSLELADAKAILEELDYAAYKKQPHAKELLDAIKTTLAMLLPDIPDAAAITLYGPATPGSGDQKTGIRVTTPYGEVPLAALSLGYQTMTAWAIDLAWRLYRHYPKAKNPLEEPAIVLIDELDLHLHPRWQRQLRKHISEAFPQVQFIATAHSPLLAQSYLDTNIAVVRLEDDHAVIINDPEVVKTWRLDELVTSALYEVDSPYSPAIEEALQRRTTLLQKKRLSPSETKELSDLEQMVAALSTVPSAEDREASEIIRRAAQLIASKQA